MQWHSAFPTKPREQGAAVVFTIRGEGWEIHHNEIGERKKCERDADEQKAMSFVRLENIGDGGDHVGDVHGKDEFTKSAIDKPKWRNGIGKDQNERKEKKKESRNRQVIRGIENKCDHGICSQRRNRKIKRIIPQYQAILAALPIDDRFIVRAEYFCQQVHAGLCQQASDQPQPKRVETKGLAEVVGNTRAEKIRQRGEKQVKRAGETEEIFQCTVSDFRFTIP